MKNLADTAINNFIIAFLGTNFIDPLFRKLTGQFPYDVRIVTIYDQDEKKRGRRIRNILKRTNESIVFVIRDEKAALEDVLFIPSARDLM